MLHKMLEVYQDKLDRKMVALSSEWKDCCERCDKCNSSPDPEDHFSPNVEAFEVSGEIVCDECAEEVFEESSQFGVGA
jgi:hypothetical protein